MANFVRRTLLGGAITACVAALGCGDDSGVTPMLDASVPENDAQSPSSDESAPDGATTPEAAVGSPGDATTSPDGAASVAQDGSAGTDATPPGPDSGNGSGPAKLADGGAALACQPHLVCCSDAGVTDYPQCPIDWASAQSCAYEADSVWPSQSSCDGQNAIVVAETEFYYVFLYDAATGALLARVTYDLGEDGDIYRPPSMTCDATGDGFVLSEVCFGQFVSVVSAGTYSCNIDAGAPRYYCSGP